VLAGTIAGASYALLSTHQGVLGFAAHATHFVMLAALVGLVLALRAEETRRPAIFFWSGLAFGIGFLMKQPGIFLGAFAFFYLAAKCRPENGSKWAPWAMKMGAFLFGGVLPFAVTCALLYHAGVFQSFWFWTFAYARQYAAVQPLRRGVEELTKNFSYLLVFLPWLWALALVGISAVFWDPIVRRRALFVFGLVLFSCAAVCPGLYFRPHYFVLMMPAVAILIAIAVVSATRLLTAKFTSRWLRVLPVCVFAAAWMLAIHRNADFYFKLTPIQACRLCYPAHPFPEALQIAEYLRQHTAPTDTIMVFGSEPEIYFYAQRHSASGYIYTFSLMEDQAYWSEMQKQMMQEVEANQPAYVVVVNIWTSWAVRPGAPQLVNLATWMNRYVFEGFEEAGIAEMVNLESHYSNSFADASIIQRSDLEAHCFWGDEARGHRRPNLEIRIFRRKS
jgi:hypothetical protein